MTTNVTFPITIPQLETFIKNKFEHNSVDDLSFSVYKHKDQNIAVFSISYLIDTNTLVNALLSPLLEHNEAWTTESLINILPLANTSTTKDLQEVLDNLITGSVYIYIEGETEIVTAPLKQIQERSLDKSETESVVIGPQISFTESLNTNLNIIRQIIPTTDLVIEKFKVGKNVPREVRMIYMKSVANDEDVNTMRQRIEDIDVDEIEDSTVLKQYIEDSSFSLFPQFVLTELPSHVSYVVKEGKIGVLVENSPNAFIAPSTFFSFFETADDNYLRWIQTSIIRLLRFISIPIALLLTPLYIAITTFHYELAPTELIMTIGHSRAGVPFPPIIEVLMIELMIELLREAGIRLPTKIGETMGIVGGLVIGQAAVEAGITSNVLIVVVAASALASFTTPSYFMGTAFRFIRFILIILTGMYGLLGLLFGISLIIIHLLRTLSLGRPYLSPLYPLRLQDFNQAFFRSPPSKNSNRATIYRPKDQKRYSQKDAEALKDIKR